MPKTKEVTKGNAARMRIKAGIDKACDAVRPTLGAVGMTALIEWPGLDPIESDDGVTILKSLEFADHYENMGLQALRKAAVRTSVEGGDGTATTTTLTQALVEAAFEEIRHDSSKIREVRERLDAGLAETLKQLSALKRDITEADIERIATISSLDPEVAKIIAEVIKQVGVNGVVTVEKGSKMGYVSEVVKGARFDKGLISPFFINDPAAGQTILEDAYIVLVDRKISTNEQVLKLLQSIGTGKSILFIATDVDSVALGTLAQNAMNRIAHIACVQNPYSASRARDFLFDMAALTGATVISEEMGMRLDDQTVAVCGRAEKVIVTRHNTTIIGGRPKNVVVSDLGTDPDLNGASVKEQSVLQSRILSIEEGIESTTSEYEKSILEDRLAQLTGGIGVIRVGAYTDIEYNAKKLKFENAINASQAALQEGILPGGGVALANVRIKDPMFQKALRAPIRQMARNAGMYDEQPVWKFWATPSVDKTIDAALDGSWIKGTDWGIDFRTKRRANMISAGIIDPYKVVRLALESATAITKMVVGMETAIVIEDHGQSS